MSLDTESPESLAWAELQRRGSIRPRYLRGIEAEIAGVSKRRGFARPPTRSWISRWSGKQNAGDCSATARASAYETADFVLVNS